LSENESHFFKILYTEKITISLLKILIFEKLVSVLSKILIFGKFIGKNFYKKRTWFFEKNGVTLISVENESPVFGGGWVV